MQQHPVIGDDLCRTVRSFDSVRPIVRHHHERLDGRGYPDGLAGDEIPLLAQIVTIVDVFDALTTNRPYRKALSTAAALATMRSEARQGAYAPALLEQFVELIPSRAVPRPAWPFGGNRQLRPFCWTGFAVGSRASAQRPARQGK